MKTQCGTCLTAQVTKTDAVQQVRTMQKTSVARAILEVVEVVAAVVEVGAAQAGDDSFFNLFTGHSS